MLPPARSRSSPAPAPTARATRRRSARSSPTGSASPFEDVEVLHGDTQIAHKGLDTYGSRSLVVGGEALVRAADKVIEKARPIAAHLLEASRRRPRVRRRPVHRQGHRPGHGDRRDRARRRSPRTTCPDGRGAELDADATFDPVNFYYPARHPPVRDGGRHRDRRGDDAQVRLRRRHRQHHQPADRRGPGARRPGAGHRAGAVGGGGLRRRPARWCPGRSSTTCCRRRPTRSRFEVDHTDHAVDDQHARHQGRRRGRHHRLDAGGGQRGRRRGPPPRASTTSRCRARPSGCGRRSTTPSGGGDAPTPSRRRCRTSTRPATTEERQ